MRLGVIGSRNFYDYDLVKSKLDRIHLKHPISSIVSGGAKGADSFGERWATENNITKNIYLPDWNKYGKRAGFIRNESIIKNSDAVIAFWDGKSKGTKNSLELCDEYEVKCLVVYI